MITLFSIPKAFKSHINVIQRNAIKSWTLLHPEIEVILLGDDEGTAETAKEFDVRHIPDVVRNEYGTPLLNSVFDIAQAEATNNIVTYVNADIILMSDFLNAVKQIPESPFLMAGQRWELDVTEELDFNDLDWERKLRTIVFEKAKLQEKGAIDYFVSKRGFWKNIPPFAIGRTSWDQWLISYAREVKAPVIDASDVVVAVHQNHEYKHRLGDFDFIWKGPEAEKNIELAGAGKKFSLNDSTVRLTPNGFKRPTMTPNRFYRTIEALPIYKPRLRLLSKFILMLLDPLVKMKMGIINFKHKS
jgi:hypothetical protein